MNYKIWDKTSPINGVSAETILENRLDLRNEKEIFLIEDDYRRVTNIELVSIIKSNLQLDNSLTAEQTAEAYIKHIETVNENLNKDSNILEINNTDIESLKVQNENLTKMISNLMVENKKKDVIANNLATTIAQLNIKVNKLESANK